MSNCSYPHIFQRVERMMGSDFLARLASTRIALFGLGGVGSWCAETLARSGVGGMLLVDSDRVEETNVNRQLMATTETLGQMKIEVLARRLASINPALQLTLRAERYTAASAATFPLADYDYVIDAIDSLPDKVVLIRQALAIPSVTLLSSMGAALKLDPAQIRTTPFRQVQGDGLARALRQRFKKSGGLPARDFTCVWSPEKRENLGPGEALGTLAPSTGIFGLTLASLVLQREAAALQRPSL